MAVTANITELVQQIEAIVTSGADAYQLAVAFAQFSGTREQWLESLKGATGKNIELGVSATHIQWRVVGDAVWTDLIALSALQGPAGLDAVNSYGSPVQRTVAWGTAYQATDSASPAKITAIVETTVSATNGTAERHVALRMASTSGAAPTGTIMDEHRSSITNNAIAAFAQTQRVALHADLPAGWYFALTQVVGTDSTIVAVYDQAIG